MSQNHTETLVNNVKGVCNSNPNPSFGRDSHVQQVAPGRHPASARKINTDQILKIATWNVRTLQQKGKLENVVKKMDRVKLNILGLAEVSIAPSLQEVIVVVNKARAKSAPGLNGVPYLLYKRCPNVLKKLHKILRSAWKNIKISKEWMTAEGVYIPKEQDSRGINQFRPISLLNVECKLFFSVMASRLTKHLTENGYLDTSVQKGGIPGVSGCLEHATMIWEAIQRAKSEKLNLDVVWLDLANAYGSVPYEMIQLALRMYHVPEVIQVMLDDYFTKGEIHPSSTSSTVFITESGVKKWHGGSIPINTHRKGLLDGCDNWVVSADLPEWERHPDVIRKTALRPDIVIHSASTQQIIMVELTVPYESRMEVAHAFKEAKYLELTKELKKDGYEAKVMPVEIGARGFVGSSAYGLLSKLSIGGIKRTKALRLLAETAENSSRWI
ncbi:reverse transcriptase [Plakobranchus ocellatus]|uniref:Reverse transcriptase n=1 Tax=Plakobranchus ocellatus TaxID=259542 RepID=A0AAV4BW16_9GAST|nr:reverse transcriptase [Plakobranchus ocellatus]